VSHGNKTLGLGLVDFVVLYQNMINFSYVYGSSGNGLNNIVYGSC
jgi:hypothetical protein